VHSYGIWFEKKSSLHFSAHKPQQGEQLVDFLDLIFLKPSMGEPAPGNRNKIDRYKIFAHKKGTNIALPCELRSLYILYA
jgi:hypothetical protein